MLKNIKSNKKGFTIVELLIVIVVIAILAAISIVAYNGIQNRGKQSSAQTLASQIAKKAEAWNAVESPYPNYCKLVTNTSNATGTGTGAGTAGCTAGATTGPGEAKLDSPGVVSAVAPTDEKSVQYARCTNNGFIVTYRTFPSGTATITGGTATGTCSAA